MRIEELYTVSPYDGTLKNLSPIFDEELEGIHQTLTRLEERWILPIPDASKFFSYERLATALFLEMLRSALPVVEGRRFLELGCGIGTNLVFMHWLGWEVAGVDRHEPYIEAAQQLAPSARVVVADVREMESFDADLVYMYRPLVDEHQQRELEYRIASMIPEGAVLALPGALSEELPLQRVASQIWKK